MCVYPHSQQAVTRLMQTPENAALLEKIVEKGNMADKALSDFAETEDDPAKPSTWTFAQEAFGTKVWFRMEDEEGSLSLKVEGEEPSPSS